MSLSSAIHDILSKIEDWWKDHEDERLDEIVDLDRQNIRNNATNHGMMAYQAVKSVRNSRNDS